ncbi:MAG: response regulator transcription factor [Solirubrobacteraceae bacterium]
MQVLVVEDDERIASFLAKGLTADGYAVTVAGDGEQAMGALGGIGEDLAAVLLDLTLPGIDGLEILRTIRAENAELPVLIVTARGELNHRIAGLNAGANDYIVKPFAFDELLARLRAALRTSEGKTAATTLTVDDLSFDLITKVARRGERMIELTPREWALLELFMRHPTQILSRVQILNRVWDYGFDPGSNVVDVYVGYLRRKLNGPGEKPLLSTIRGAGYRLLAPR